MLKGWIVPNVGALIAYIVLAQIGAGRNHGAIYRGHKWLLNVGDYSRAAPSRSGVADACPARSNLNKPLCPFIT